MPKYIALLRGINVSGKNKIKMQDLRVLLAEHQLTNVQTYIQSGNVLFDSDEPAKTLASKIEKAIHTAYGFDVPVLVKTKSELKKMATANPYLKDRSEEIRFLALAFLEDKPKKEQQEAIETTKYLPDEWQADGKGIYLFCPNGFGRTKLTNNFFERKLKMRATTRNWKTVLKLLEMLA